VTFNDLAKYPATRNIARPLCVRWVSCHRKLFAYVIRKQETTQYRSEHLAWTELSTERPKCNDNIVIEAWPWPWGASRSNFYSLGPESCIYNFRHHPQTQGPTTTAEL